MEQLSALDSLNDEMQTELNECRLSFFEEHIDDMEEVKEEYKMLVVP